MEIVVVWLWIQDLQVSELRLVDFGVSFWYYNNVKYFT